MAEQSYTPGDYFAEALKNQIPQALAWVRGDEKHSELSGLVRFYPTSYGGVLVEAEVFGLPDQNRLQSSSFFGFHIHEFGSCSGTPEIPFKNAGGHYNPLREPHPFHEGDLPPLLSSRGYAWQAFYDKRFTIKDIIGKSVVIHSNPDDFTTQPSGNAGSMIGCGEIKKS